MDQHVAGQGTGSYVAHPPHPTQAALEAALPLSLPVRQVHPHPARERVDDTRRFGDGYIYLTSIPLSTPIY